MSSFSSDPWIDDELKNVAMPPELIAKLQAIVSLDDAEIDRALCDVPVRAEFMERLASIGTGNDQDLQDELRHIVVPASVVERGRRIPREERGRSSASIITIRRLAIAASLFVAAGIGYLAATAVSVGNRPGAVPNEPDTIAANRSEKSDDGSTELDLPELTNRLADDETPAPNIPDVVVPTPKVDALELRPSQVAGVNKQAASASSDPTGERRRQAEGILAGPSTSESVPTLRSAAEPVWRGVVPPVARGYDLSFQLKHGVHPFVSPSVNPALAAIQVPLVTSTASFDRALQLASERKLPPADKIRTEEFLAAMDYQFPLPANGQVALRSAAGPSPWSSAGLNLLQVAVQAGRVPRRNAQPTHTVLLVDGSASMQWEGRWQAALAGVAGFCDQLTERDQVSLVIANGQPKPVAQRLSPADCKARLADLARQLPNGDSSMVASLTSAVDVARNDPKGAETTRIVLLTDGIGRLDDAVNDQIDQILLDAVRQGYRLEVVDVRADETLDAQLNQLAAAGSRDIRPLDASLGVVRHAGTSDRIRWALVDAVTGQSQLVAADATMKVTFKPDAVSMYRLMGHEATSVINLASLTIEADLRSGEAATGLFEVALKPDGGDTVAIVEVTWRDPASGKMQTTRQTISRFQFAPSFLEAPLSLQLAALAAETAEVLRDSYFAPPSTHSLGHVAELSRQLSPRLRSRPSFARLLSLVDSAQRAQVVSP